MNTDYSPEELTEDGLPTLDAQIRRMEERDAELTAQDQHKQLAMRVKCLSLNHMGLSPLHNTFSLDTKQRTILQDIMRTYEDKLPEQIVQEFNEVCNEKIFNTQMEMSKLPMYHV